MSPTNKVISERRQEPGDLPAGRSAGPEIDLDDPQIQKMLGDFAIGYEKRWLEDNIPALGGLTPRQAAADPTRRDELIRLLNSFDDLPAGPGGMDPDRLRAALGL